MSRSREFLTIIAAIAACFVLVALLQKPESQNLSSRSIERPRREANDEGADEEEDASCEGWIAGVSGEECENNNNNKDDDIRGKTGGAAADESDPLRRGKGNKKKQQATALDINSDEVNTQIVKLNGLLMKRIETVDRRAPRLELAQANPDTVRPGNWPNNINDNTAAALGENCAAGAAGRLTPNTKALYMLYPKDMAFMDSSETGINNADLLDIYMNFFTTLAANTVGVDNSYFGSYAANSFIKVSNGAPVAPEAFSYSSRGSNLRVLQPDLGKVFARFVTTIRKHARRDMSQGLGDQCSAVIIIHTLPKDYKDFNNLDFDTSFNAKCTVIPVFVAPSADLIPQFQSMAAAFHPEAVNQFKVASEREMNPYHVLDAGANLANKMQRLADAIPSYLCALENRVQCNICADAYVPQMSTTSFPVSESSAWPDTESADPEGDYGGWREAETTTIPWSDSTVAEEEKEPSICCGASPSASQDTEINCVSA